ncbi:hemerythrin domain-containing protein [Virgibacillus kimchii]
MTNKKGMKRHESLKDLSRHHMIGLHLALKLKRAGTEKSRLSIEEIMKDADDFWNPGGQEHFREEEEILLPAYAQYEDINKPEVIEMLMEHVKLRSLFDQLLKLKETDLDMMHELGALLENHIRKEERVLFPMIEKALPEEKLQELAPYLH